MLNYQFSEKYKKHMNKSLKEMFIVKYVEKEKNSENQKIKDFLNDTSR